ncbi:uncharacterized protein LOC111696116 isoform X3 [Eurytemora carolleeae]|uniref:uncharacterized protein LOC111696116 isoform X3 n=1 Tax=Eurytemora carolleeae TaxID=1294199 RepID=UPI000C77ECCD|nr:uncharacterized protein LOC111696116 isoform X3 [Eurytemora carolleeae]|eukprot:XP_023321428.1 uncharacterized protein LOC111696116 isoform X3 [Eurytemora affinis]
MEKALLLLMVIELVASSKYLISTSEKEKTVNGTKENAGTMNGTKETAGKDYSLQDMIQYMANNDLDFMEKAWKALLTSEESSSETESYEEEEPEETVSEEEDSEDFEDTEEEDTADNEDDEK